MAPQQKSQQAKDTNVVDTETTAAAMQNEELGGADVIIDPGPGYPQVAGEPSAQAKMGTPLDPDGHTRVAEAEGRTTGVAYEEASQPIQMDDAEQAAEVNKEAMDKATAGVEGVTDKATRGPKEQKK